MSNYIGKNIIRLSETDSTNKYALDLISSEGKIDDGTVVLASYQTGGKGMGSNKWLSDLNKNLTFSIVFFPDFIPPDEVFSLSKIISLGIADYLKTIFNDVFIKWPNDIYVGNKKIAGILIENAFTGNQITYSVCGIGLNVNQKDFNKDIPNPISMNILANKEYETDDVLKHLLTYIENRYLQLQLDKLKDINKDYHSYLLWINENHVYKAFDEEFAGKIIRVEENGELIIELKDKSYQGFYFKEIEFVK